VAPPVRAAALRLLCVLAAAAPNINANVVAAYFMVRVLTKLSYLKSSNSAD
jgi:hypothetical protein